MPTYEYRCPDCGHEFEEFQRMSDKPVAACPQCGSAAERLLSAGAGLLFKGDGFYITDNRSDAYKKKAKNDQGASPSGESGAKTPAADSKSGAGESKGGGSESKTGGSKGSAKSGGDD